MCQNIRLKEQAHSGGRKREILIPLTPTIFKRMLRLPTINKVFKLLEVDSFMDTHGSDSRLLKESMKCPLKGQSNLNQVYVDILAEPYKEYCVVVYFLG